MILKSRRSNNIFCYIICIVIVILIMASHNLKIRSKKELLAELPDSAKAFIAFKEEGFNNVNISTLRTVIKSKNKEEFIRNIDIFGSITINTNILVIRVHKFSDNLKLLLASLSAVKGIEDALLIFSHSYFDNNVNRLIQRIDFCRVLQIFYPLSLQAYPNVFPGYSLNDCPSYLDIHTALRRKCTGASTPDIHGRYRKPEASQEKHYWWWTANRIFDGIPRLASNQGIVVFLNEDQYLFEDFLYILINMKEVADTIPYCDIISLGDLNPNVILNENDTYRLEVTTWEFKHSEVIAFDRSTWNTIVSHFDLFCLLDDYSWARSLQYISLNRLDGKRFKVISSVMPRSFKSSCGSFGAVTDCDVNEGIFKALQVHKQQRKNLFPPYLEVYLNIELLDDEYIIFDILDNNGGWNDNRDKELCNNITLHKVKKILLDMNSQFN